MYMYAGFFMYTLNYMCLLMCVYVCVTLFIGRGSAYMCRPTHKKRLAHIYMYSYIHVGIFLYILLYMRLIMCVCVCVCVSGSVSVDRVCVCLSLLMYAEGLAHMYTYTCVHVGLFMNTLLYMCLLTSVYVCV